MMIVDEIKKIFNDFYYNGDNEQIVYECSYLTPTITPMEKKRIIRDTTIALLLDTSTEEEKYLARKERSRIDKLTVEENRNKPIVTRMQNVKAFKKYNFEVENETEIIPSIQAACYVLLEQEFSTDIDHISVYNQKQFDEIVSDYNKKFGSYLITGKSDFMNNTVTKFDLGGKYLISPPNSLPFYFRVNIISYVTMQYKPSIGVSVEYVFLPEKSNCNLLYFNYGYGG